MLKNKMFIAMIVAVMCMSVVSLSGCKKDKVVLNSQQNNSEGTWFHVKHAGFTTLNKSYEEFKAETLKRGKSGTPYSEETLRELYQEKLESDRWFYDQGFDGYPLQEEIEQWEKIKNDRISSSGQNALTSTPKFVSGLVPHYYEWNSTENPNGYNWCGHAALKSVCHYHGSLKTLSQIHTRFLSNSSAYYNGGLGRCGDGEYCASMIDMLYATNVLNNSSSNYQFPNTGTATKSTVSTFFQQLRDGVDYNKPVIVASNYLEPYGHFYPVTGYKLVYAANGSIDYNASQLYLRNVQEPYALTPLYDNIVSVQTFFNQRRSNDLLIVRPGLIIS